MEGILFGIAAQNPADFNSVSSAPKDKNNKVKLFNEWTLAQLVDVSYELGWLKLDVKKFSHVLRDFRNYIHPAQQLKEKFNPDKHTAEICFQTVKAAISNLSEKKK